MMISIAELRELEVAQKVIGADERTSNPYRKLIAEVIYVHDVNRIFKDVLNESERYVARRMDGFYYQK